MTNNTIDTMAAEHIAFINGEQDIEQQRISALALYLSTDAETIEQQNYAGGYSDVPELEADNGSSYLVLTDEEADTATRAYITSSLWAFSPSFLAEHTELPVVVFEALAKQYEDANEAVESIIEKCGDMDDFVAEAVEADGRGHFLGQYDSEENEQSYYGQTFYIYRTN